jgi:LPS export ABC transporter protein LptC
MQIFRSSYLLFFSVAAMLFIGISSCENNPQEIDQLFKKEIGVEEGKQIESYFSQGGIVKAKLVSPYMQRYQTPDSPYIIFPTKLHVDFYDTTLKIESTLDALYAKYTEYDRKILLLGKDNKVVVINLKNKDTLLTSKLLWDQDKQQFTTDDSVHVHQPDKVVNGKGLQATQDFSSWTIFNSRGHALPQSGELE